MLNKKFSALLVTGGLLACSIFSSLAQVPTKKQDLTKDYIPLVSQGSLPEDFTVSASEKAMKDIKKVKQKGGKDVNNKIRFITGNTFFIDNVLKSGKVLYGDPISQYVSKVMDEIVKSQPAMKIKPRVYVVKSPVVNAYSFDSGVIFVTTGLISQLEDESQLSFVLCHELVHFLKKHSISAYLDFIKMDSKKRTYNKNGTDLLLEKSKYSKKNEFQADAEGFEMFTKTSYSYSSLDGLYDVLQYSYLPFDEVELDKGFLDDNSMKIPKTYYRESVREISASDNDDDSLSTHPNAYKRRKVIEEKVKNLDNTGRNKFVVSEEDFMMARELARFETCRLYMQQLQYPDAIYSSYILLKKYPENRYLKKIVARALYETAVYKTHYEKYYYNFDYKNGKIVYYKKPLKSKVQLDIDLVDSIQGSSQQVYHLLQKLSPLEMTVVALNNNWRLNKELDYKDTYTQEICDSLMRMLAGKYSLTIDNFSKTPYVPKTDTATTVVVDKKQEDSKYAKIKKKQKQSGLGEGDFTKYAFVDMLNDPKFQEHYKAAQSLAKKEKKAPVTTASNKKKTPPKKTPNNKKGKKGDDEDDDGGTETADGPVQDSVKVDITEVQAASQAEQSQYSDMSSFKMLGIDKVVILAPFYMKLDMRKKDNVSYFSGESKLKEFTSLIAKNSDLLKLETEILNPHEFGEDDIDKYNSFSFINDWVTERFQHGDFTRPLVLNDEFKEKIVKTYGTSHVMLMGAVNMRQKKKVGAAVLFSFLFPYAIPYTLYYVATPDYDTYFYAIMFDVETGKVELFNEHQLSMKDRTDVLNSVIYDTFYQVKKTDPNKGAVSSTKKKK